MKTMERVFMICMFILRFIIITGFPNGTDWDIISGRTLCHSLLACVFYIVVMKGLVCRGGNHNANPPQPLSAIVFRHQRDSVFAFQVMFDFLEGQLRRLPPSAVLLVPAL